MVDWAFSSMASWLPEKASATRWKMAFRSLAPSCSMLVRVVCVPFSIASFKPAKEQKRRQAEWQLAAGSLWHNDRNLIFTDHLGEHIKHRTVNNHFKKIVASIGLPDVRFHDLRHSYAVNALQAGDPIKVVQEQLGHYSSAFTMDIYAAVSDTMRKQSQDRMEQLFKDVSDL